MSQDWRALLAADTLGASRSFINGMTRANRTLFSGLVEPATPEPLQLWADTTAGRLKMRTGAGDGWTDLGPLGSANLGALARSGGIMTGVIDMGGFQVINVGLGTGASAARQQEVDLKAGIASPAFTGDVTVDQDPAGNDSLIRRIWAEARYVRIAGATMTGKLTLSGNADANLEAVPRQQLAEFIGFDLAAGHRHTGGDARQVRATDLDAVGSSAGQLLASAGAGSPPVWTTTADQITFFQEVLQVLDTDGIGWTTLNLSAVVPAGARAVILAVQMNGGFTNPASYFSAIFKVRKTGTTPAAPATYTHRDQNGVLTNLTLPFQVIAEVDSSRRLDYIFTGGGLNTFAHVNAKLVGYFS